ncbi:hypothetical protein ASF40_19875 [Microbacterium sp. Leaf288]|uniref:ROK family transcriptional regulator n=1 Tax=Microbacterium sp. Leaf288 TaxID=1736323 RepID=UPI000700629C|nr:ROK family transcriptional regulator [Microbacterium sp. Leaf288]KQP68045.1 hypothetical protein ASF40_19875 [Microbacterium sp. Leaf288]
MAGERQAGLSAVLDAIRRDDGVTQTTLTERVGLGRSVVAERVTQLQEVGLILSAGRGPSTGGRAPRRLSLNPDAGFVLGIDIEATGLVVGVANMAGNVLSTRREPIDVRRGPEEVMSRIFTLADEIVAENAAAGNLLGAGVGIPGPVDFDAGAPLEEPLLPGWAGYPLRDELSRRLPVPVWVDGRANLLALVEVVTNPRAARANNLLYFGGGSSTAAAMIVGGSSYRGAHGLAGSVGHIAVPEAGMVSCVCGRVGCLDAVASRWAIARDGLLLAQTGRSAALAGTLAQTGAVEPYDITLAAQQGDVAARELIERAAAVLGRTLSNLLSFFAPDMLVIGGGVARARDYALEPLRAAIHERLPPAATADLIIEFSVLDDLVSGVLGATQLAIGELFNKANVDQLLLSAAGRADGTPPTR